MEPDGTADKAASQDFKQSTQTRDMEPARKGATAPKSETTETKVTSTTTTQMTEIERSDLLQGDSSSSSESKSPQTDRRFPFNDMEIFKKPMRLVSTGEENVLELEQETVEQIAKIDWPLVVVTIAGLYRTGKSYLMNRLAGSIDGFKLGDTIEAETKGIWVWCKIHPEKSNTVLLLLDTEGLGDVSKGDSNHDNKMFTLATLLCNCLVYNTKGAFDQDAVNKLTFVTEIAKNIRFKGTSLENNSSLSLILPDFVLCVRDFNLKLFKKGQGKITEDQYLEGSLENQEGKDERINKPRECIRKYFLVRKCFTFPVPGDGDVLENLETLPFSNLSPKFQEATIRFVSFIYSRPPKALLASKPINGQMFATLATCYVTAIAHDAVPDVDDAFMATAKLENSRVEKEALEIFETQMKKITLPVPSRDLGICFSTAQQTALSYLYKNAVNVTYGEREWQAELKMDNLCYTLKGENAKKIKEMCGAKLQEIYRASMEEKVEKKVYEVKGGHKNFRRDIEKMKEDFMSTLRNFEEHEILWTWLGLLEEMKKTEEKIIQADDALTLKEKEDERKRNEENMKRVKDDSDKSKDNALAEQKKAIEIHQYKLTKLLEDRLKKDEERFERLAQEKLEAKQEYLEMRQDMKKQIEILQQNLHEMMMQISRRPKPKLCAIM